MTSKVAEVSIIDDPAAVASTLRFIERFFAAESGRRDLASRLCIVLEELVTNTLTYAYPDRTRHAIRIRIDEDGQNLIVVYEDGGAPFDPLKVPDPDFDTPVEQWPIGRLGIHLVRRLVDHIAYERVGDANRITLLKRIRAQLKS